MLKLFATGSARSQIYSSSTVSTALKLVWVFVIVWGELGIFYWSFTQCHWPSIDAKHNSRQNIKTTHVLLIADTQVRHPSTFANTGYRSMNAFRRVLFELNLRKNWHIASNLNPHAVIFLGDMLADGKTSRNAEDYDAAVQKFKSIFEITEDEEVHYIPGNEDVGLGSVSSISKNLRSHYARNFGPLNTKFVIANHTFIGLDAPGLVDEDYQRHASHITFDDWKPIPGGPISFIKEVSEGHPSHSILLTHIPLSRTETADCGPQRERGGIRRGAGPGYQSMLGRDTTSFLLKALEPLMVFSADNRDYCDHTHALPGTPQYSASSSNFVREVTVKSFSMAPYITRPGFQLLSLIEPAKLDNFRAKSLADRQCLLPDQDKIYASLYFPSLVFTLLVMIAIQLRGRRRKPLRTLTPLISSPRSSGHSTPVLMQTDPAQFSATWSPFSPFIPTSPRIPLPSYLRAPRSPSNSTTHLVASLPGSPSISSPSTLLVPMPYSGDDDGEDNDTMYPTQYATRRDSYSLHSREDDKWSHARDEEDYDIVHDSEFVTQSVLLSSHQPEFISAPSHSKNLTASKDQAWTWSYTFVLKGRRRRISLSLPSWNSLHNLLDFLGFSNETTGFGARRRQTSTPLAVLGVLWPAIVVWIIINWTIL